MSTLQEFQDAPVDARAVSPSGKQTYRKTAALDGAEWVQETDGTPEWASSGSLVAADYRLDPGSLWRNNLVFAAPAPSTPAELEAALWDACHPVKEGQVIPRGTRCIRRHKGEPPNLHVYEEVEDWHADIYGSETIRTFEPLPESDWLDAPAVLASTDFCDDRRVYAPEEGTDRQTWRCACCAEPQSWTSLRDVTPLYPREGTDA